MDEKVSDSDYDYFCVDCRGMVDPKDTVCTHCGADISEFVDEDEESETARNFPACPLCKGQSFQREERQVHSPWGFTSRVMIFFICDQCQYVLPFSEGNSIWDLDES